MSTLDYTREENLAIRLRSKTPSIHTISISALLPSWLPKHAFLLDRVHSSTKSRQITSLRSSKSALPDRYVINSAFLTSILNLMCRRLRFWNQSHECSG